MLSSTRLRELHVECGLESRGGPQIVETLAAHGFVAAGDSGRGESSDVTFVRR